MIAEIITSISVLGSAIIAGYYSVKVKRLESESTTKGKAITRLKAELTCVNVLFDTQMIQLVNEKVDYLFKNTQAERFIILFALNGKSYFNFVSVCYEKTKSDKTRGSIYRYVRLQIDDHYRTMLKLVEREKAVYMKVAEMPPSLLKDIYESLVEGVKYSSVHFIDRRNLDDDNDVLIYSSLATTIDQEFSNSEKVIIKSTFDEIRSHSGQIDFHAKLKEQ